MKKDFNTFEKEQHRAMNALYVSLYRKYADADTDFGALFLHTEATWQDYDNLSEEDQEIADEMTEREEKMAKAGWRWNEDNYCDYETAMNSLIQCMDRGYGDPVWCDVCGQVCLDGYRLNGDYACSDECRNRYFMEKYGLENAEDAEKAYLLASFDKTPDSEEGKELMMLSAEELREKAENEEWEENEDVEFCDWL